MLVLVFLILPLQDDLCCHVSEQNSERSVLGHVDSGHLESDLSDQSHGDQAGQLIPDSVCSDWVAETCRLARDCLGEYGIR